ncbi:hypothetical protein DICSQDRAFT_170696 [Dichomitus squalens LYAD-421 SS1]|uniref:Uncharacterized protein n=1 Tax=Dichomitus squalens (strain LYAD-421) TaxID=732165 RepID=R7T0Y6_DICSQ|nr:uncharacterized protein DICSQDRAFT_170696 [Dichomitus squalens LYAD-421 SS1]EJF60837.1 hypothetical protein DICSQDRAFT_170696 [Dichomitus squalens LYAD-421 SS1]
MCYHQVQPTPYNPPRPSLLCVATTELVVAADIIISLLPVPFHPSVAELCNAFT